MAASQLLENMETTRTWLGQPRLTGTTQTDVDDLKWFLVKQPSGTSVGGNLGVQLGLVAVLLGDLLVAVVDRWETRAVGCPFNDLIVLNDESIMWKMAQLGMVTELLLGDFQGLS